MTRTLPNQTAAHNGHERAALTFTLTWSLCWARIWNALYRDMPSSSLTPCVYKLGVDEHSRSHGLTTVQGRRARLVSTVSHLQWALQMR